VAARTSASASVRECHPGPQPHEHTPVAEVLGSVGARRVGALAAYDAQLRDRVPELLPSGVTVERDGPLLRFLGLAGRGFVVYRDMGGLEGAELDELISRQVEVFAERGEPFEWKPHGHDPPNDLSQRLHAAGFVQEEPETIVIAPAADIAVAEVRLPKGVSLREVTSRADFERIAGLSRRSGETKTSGIGSSTCSRRSVRSMPGHLRLSWQRPFRPSSVPRGSASSTTPNSRRSGAARPCHSGPGAGSIAPASPTGRASLLSVDSATSRRAPPTTAAASSSVSASPRSRRPRRTSGRLRRIRQQRRSLGSVRECHPGGGGSRVLS
jgi:hypothetical protein